MSKLPNKRNKPSNHPLTDEESQENSGPNLVLIYSLLALALVAAMACAAAIVWPFYVRR